MLRSDWSIQKMLRSDWLVVMITPLTTNHDDDGNENIIKQEV